LNIRKRFWLRFLEKNRAGMKADLGGFHAASRRDLAQVADHIRDDSDIEILEGSAPLRAEPVH
jgi:hypothetical protein